MARSRANLAETLADDEHPDDSEQPTAEKKTTPPKKTAPAKKATKSAGKKTAAKTASKSTKRPQKRTQAATPEKETEQAAPPRVRVPESTEDAKRTSVNLHKDDYRALMTAKLDDDADINARMRAMIALWQSSPRFRSQVDKLARTAPRGGGH